MDNHTKAKKLARGIFQLGDEPDSPAQRMEFKGGEWPEQEVAQGGICEKALSSVIYRLLTQLEEIEE